MQYTIETRPLNIEEAESSKTIEASDPREALSHFARDSQSEIVSFHRMEGRESIATVRRNEAVFLVRVYSN